jgi:hypothetical protein
MQRVKGEEGGDKSAFPDFMSHAVKKPEEQQRAEDMEDEVGDMITAGIQTVELIIEHQRKPGQGMPEIGISGTECPANGFKRDAGPDMIVFGHVNIIINIDEFKLNNLIEDGERDTCQNDENDYLGGRSRFIQHYLCKGTLLSLGLQFLNVHNIVAGIRHD